MSGALATVSGSLRTLATAVQNVVDTDRANCLFYRGCPGNVGFGVYDNSGLSTQGSAYNFGNTAVNLTRMVGQPFANDSGNANYSCWAQAMLPAAISNLNTNKNYTVYQYVTWKNGQLNSYPAENWNTSYACPSNSFDPRTRPWYVTAVTPPMNIIIVLSTRDCASGCFAKNKAAALAVLTRCGFWNFVGVVAYDEVVIGQIPLDRATTSYLQAATSFVNSLNVSAATTSGVGVAMKAANTMLSATTTGGDPVVIWISDGTNDDANINPVTAIQLNGINPHVFPVLIGYSANTTLALPRQFACFTNSVFITLTGTMTVSQAIDNVFAAIASGINSNVIRPSEPYIDEASGLNTVSLGLVLYQNNEEDLAIPVGAVTIDVTTAFLTNYGAISQDNLVAYLLSTQVYTAISIPAAVIAKVTDDDNVCTPLVSSINYTSPQWLMLFGLWVAVSVLGMIIVALLAALLPCCTRTSCCNSYSREKAKACFRRLVLLHLVVTLPFVVLALGVGWGFVWPQYVVNQTFKQATMRVVAQTDNPFRCCDTVNCLCQEAGAYPTCSSLLASLTAGPCNIGYYCCARYCYSCNCRTTCSRRLLGEEEAEDNVSYLSDYLYDFNAQEADAKARYGVDQLHRMPGEDSSPEQNSFLEEVVGAPKLAERRVSSSRSCRTTCSTCCYCTSSVNYRRCDVVCGTCYNPAVTFTYYNELTAKQVNVSRSTTCSRDNYACVTAYYATWPAIGNTFTGFYNPLNPNDVTLDVSINQVAFGFVVFFLVMTIAVMVLSIIWTCRHCKSASAPSPPAPTADTEMKPPDTWSQSQAEVEKAEAAKVVAQVVTPAQYYAPAPVQQDPTYGQQYPPAGYPPQQQQYPPQYPPAYPAATVHYPPPSAQYPDAQGAQYPPDPILAAQQGPPPPFPMGVDPILAAQAPPPEY
eukprot:TRINITY_DN5626_c0_g1_i1.p1 TRINITY_DN5626_c0_g1~~TRINITY_DN5626_c0_g1_i1.p1  ORF type:complete len:973 (+),score=213.97 TRINITY_DN5626_c0_g1_i1:149-2920(+)